MNGSRKSTSDFHCEFPVDQAEKPERAARTSSGRTLRPFVWRSNPIADELEAVGSGGHTMRREISSKQNLHGTIQAEVR
jgi:hypothetical protein